jgi:hypothetical protein
MKVKRLYILFSFLIIFFNTVSADIPELFISMDGKMTAIKGKLSQKKQKEFEEKWDYVRDNLRRIYKEMWGEFNKRGEGVLPWCIVNVFNDLKKKPRIPIVFSILNKKKIPSGDKALSETKVGTFSEAKGIIIYGVYKDYFTYGWSRKSVCLKATLFHEILHYATFYGNKSYFNIRKIRNQRGTDIGNFWADEGIIEDCELKLFPCGLEYYYKLRYSWYTNNARQHSEPVDDCELCKLCKEEK